MNNIYREDITAANILSDSETEILLRGTGNSMTPILKSKQTVKISSFKKDIDSIEKDDIVFCKVNGHFYLHKVYAIRGNQYEIGNNHGHINGWTSKKNIFGKVTEIIIP